MLKDRIHVNFILTHISYNAAIIKTSFFLFNFVEQKKQTKKEVLIELWLI